MKRLLFLLGFVMLATSASANEFAIPCISINNGINCTPASSGTPVPVTSGGITPLTPMQAGLTIASSTALTLPSGATYAVICARSQNVNYTTDGTTTPTASVGMQLLQNQCVGIQGATTLGNFRAIQQAPTATLDISYFK